MVSKDNSGLWRTEKNLNLLSCFKDWDLLLKLCWKVIEENWIHFIFFPCIGFYSCMFKWSDFFSSLGKVLGLDYPVLHFYWNNCQRVPKLFRLQMDCFCSFSVGMCFVWSGLYLHGLKFAIITQLCFFCWYGVFSIISLRGIRICSSNMPIPFNHGSL